MLAQQIWQLYGPFTLGTGTSAKEAFDSVLGPEAALVVGDSDNVPSPSKLFITSPGTAVQLNSVLADVDHAVGYARTTIHLDSPKELSFYVGSDDGVKVWIDGELVHQNNVNRAIHSALDGFKANLDAGVHELVLKVTQDRGEWAFVIETAGEDHLPLAIWRGPE